MIQVRLQGFLEVVEYPFEQIRSPKGSFFRDLDKDCEWKIAAGNEISAQMTVFDMCQVLKYPILYPNQK
jgi:hypothetical protein